MKNKIYKLTPSGRIKHYYINYDVQRFSFVSETNSLFEKVIDKVNDALNNFVGQKPYELNWEEITNQYIKIGQSDVPHFASQFVFSKFLNEGRSKEKENMQAMYLEIVAVINKEIELGRLPTEIQ
ncbi:MAG: hypothetical protein AB8B59_12685 [Maribacter sp.]